MEHKNIFDRIQRKGSDEKTYNTVKNQRKDYKSNKNSKRSRSQSHKRKNKSRSQSPRRHDKKKTFQRKSNDRQRSHSRNKRTRSHSRNRRTRSHSRNRRTRSRSSNRRNNEQEKKKIDENLRQLNDDPRIDSKANVKIQKSRGNGRNTESFDPESTFVRPDMRVIIGNNGQKFEKTLKHDDVVIVPEFFCKEDDWSLYYKLIEEMRDKQANGDKGAQWISWHEGSHLIVKDPQGSQTFQMVQDKIAKYFGIKQQSIGTRFNWYRDSSDWKPFHHDSAAFNPERAKNQNITVGVSFGATRELAFLHAKNKNLLYFPQTNGMLFSFGRDVNIQWKHAINALNQDEQDGKGRISIILWGMCRDVKNEEGDPPMLTDNTRGNGHNMHVGQQQICRDFQRGHCKYGNNCRHVH